MDNSEGIQPLIEQYLFHCHCCFYCDLANYGTFCCLAHGLTVVAQVGLLFVVLLPLSAECRTTEIYPTIHSQKIFLLIAENGTRLHMG